MRLFAIAASVSLLTGCITTQKAKDHLDSNPQEAAKYCAERFPVIEKRTTEVRVDTATYEKYIGEMLVYGDSVARVAQERNNTIDFLKSSLANMYEHKSIDQELIVKMRERLENIPVIDTAFILKQFQAKMRDKSKPCKDSIIHDVVPDRALEKVLSDKNKVLQSVVDRLKSGRNIWRKIATIEFLLILLWLGFKLYGAKLGIARGLISKL